ncbi:MAG TPA: divalent-cation tolerance protein CutA [Thermoplasmatales archaeon]|nr:divalent-cation tolerance protein CutA [Thermoplasmatales archaeon]
MYCIVITTCREEDEEKIVTALLNENLVACINSWDVNSAYIWKGKVERGRERMLFIKTRRENYKKVENRIRQLHSYEVPEILCIDVKDGYSGYLEWIDEVVGW